MKKIRKFLAVLVIVLTAGIGLSACSFTDIFGGNDDRSNTEVTDGNNQTGNSGNNGGSDQAGNTGDNGGNNNQSDPDDDQLEVYNGLVYTEIDGGYSVKAEDDTAIKVVIPSTYNGKPVLRIDEKAFYSNRSLKKVIIPDSVTSIGERAFWDCNSIVEIRYAGDIAKWCSIDGLDWLMYNFCTIRTDRQLYIGDVKITGDLVIPDTITCIGKYVFYSCRGLTSVTIPDSVTSIGDSAFENCTGLTNVTIPDSVTSVGDRAFYGCGGLAEIKYSGSMANWFEIKGLNYLMHYGKVDRKLYIDDVEITGDLVIPDGLTSIGVYAFLNCSSLTSITISDSVTSVDSGAFLGCSSLAEIRYSGSIANWVKIIGLGNVMAYGKADKKLYIDNVEITGDLVIPDNVTSIGNNAFSGCTGLTTIYCEADSQPSGWKSSWNNNCSAEVVWGYKG